MRQAVQFGLLAAIVVAFPWLAVSIAANMQSLPSGPSGPPSLSCSPNCPTSSQVVVQQTAGNALVFLFTMAVVLSLFVVSGIIAWRRKVQTSRSLWSLLAVLLLFAVVYALAGVVNILRTVSLPNPGVFNQVSYWLSFLPLALILIAGALGVKWIAQRPALTTSSTFQATPPEEKVAAVSVLDEAIHSLRSGTDPRSVVISCYRALCETLQDRGVPGTPSATAREFEVVSENALPIHHETLHRLTALFEKARYSAEEVGPGEAVEAESVLSELRSEVLGVVG
ncbi:MAG TPA: DUF4129 domain-containing protein [Nitrososphaerales archaeon]|nr:DUF4129 domain-containing protein [Nitrososphaerales archaeon]